MRLQCMVSLLTGFGVVRFVPCTMLLAGYIFKWWIESLHGVFGDQLGSLQTSMPDP